MTKTLVFIGVVLSLLLFAAIEHIAEPLKTFDATTTVHIGPDAFTLDVANTPEEREKGLSGRESLQSGTGMLFVFPVIGKYGFWMKDMAFSIDIGWLDSDWCLVYLVSHVSPASYPLVFTPKTDAQYVIEVPEGTFEAENIAEGECISPPSL